jgi:hypothetical protein
METCKECGSTYWEIPSGGKLLGEDLLRAELNLLRGEVTQWREKFSGPPMSLSFDKEGRLLTKFPVGFSYVTIVNYETNEK